MGKRDLLDIIHRNKGKMPHWCRNPSPVVTSRTNRTSTASIAALPFQVSALLVQPHSQTITGGGSSVRFESYAANNSSTLPSGTKDCRKYQTFYYTKLTIQKAASYTWIFKDGYSSSIHKGWEMQQKMRYILPRAGCFIPWETYLLNIQQSVITSKCINKLDKRTNFQVSTSLKVAIYHFRFLDLSIHEFRKTESVIISLEST